MDRRRLVLNSETPYFRDSRVVENNILVASACSSMEGCSLVASFVENDPGTAEVVVLRKPSYLKISSSSYWMIVLENRMAERDPANPLATAMIDNSAECK